MLRLTGRNAMATEYALTFAQLRFLNFKTYQNILTLQKSVPVLKEECIQCIACVTSCPTEAITVEE